MTEETHSAARSGPRGIVMSILISLIAGWVLLIGITFAIQKANYTNEATAVVAPAADLDRFDRPDRRRAAATGGDRGPAVLRDVLGDGELADDLRVLPGRGAARLGLLAPGEQADQDADQRDLAGGLARSILGLPYIWNTAAYAAVTSIATIGLYIAYVTPTFLRLRQGDNFKRGPWHLGRWTYLIGWTAVVWVVFITILFMLPQFGPINRTTFNYAVVAVVVVIGYAGIYWLVSAHKWFTGPRVQGTPEELAAIEQELST